MTFWISGHWLPLKVASTTSSTSRVYVYILLGWIYHLLSQIEKWILLQLLNSFDLSIFGEFYLIYILYKQEKTRILLIYIFYKLIKFALFLFLLKL